MTTEGCTGITLPARSLMVTWNDTPTLTTRGNYTLNLGNFVALLRTAQTQAEIARASLPQEGRAT